MRERLLPPNRRTKPPPPPAPPSDPAPVVKAAPQRACEADKARKSAARRAAVGRWLRRLQWVTGIIVVVATSVLVAWGLHRYLRSSPRFAVKHVEVEGARRRRPQQLLKRAGIANGQNIFALDTERASAALVTDPWVERAQVRKELPNKVFIKVVEREARVLLSLAGKLYLVDGGGEVFKELAAGEPYDLPVMTGIEPAALTRDRTAVAMQMRRAIELMGDLSRIKINKRYPLQEVRVHRDGTLDVIIGSDGIVLAFGAPPYRAKVAKAERILEELRHRGASPAVLFLDNRAHPERVVVRMR